jgi:hypothetical protein
MESLGVRSSGFHEGAHAREDDGDEALAPSGVVEEARADYVCIRGRRLRLKDLVDPRLLQADYILGLRERMAGARPFPYLVIEDCFQPALLELVYEEFDLASKGAWQTLRSTHGTTYRSKPGARFGPATQVYFGIVNSGWFVDFLAEVSGVDRLLSDARLHNGGLHETRTGGWFDVHTDFDRHAQHGLNNELAFITYLNPSWDPSNGGALELWDGKAARPVVTIPPRLGSSVLLRHGPGSFHGHRAPWSRPDGEPRRTVASYYYSSRAPRGERRTPTTYLFPDGADRLLRAARRTIPPVIYDFLVSISRR